jgi:transposase
VQAGARHRAEPDWAAVARGLKRPAVTLQILWEEYRGAQPDVYSCSRDCQLFPEFERRLSPSMRQHHVAGEKAFVDYSGKKVPIFDSLSGEFRHAEIFVGVLGASNLTYAEPSWTQALPDWIGAHLDPTRKRGALTIGMDRGEHPAKLKRLGRHKSFDVLGEYLEFGDLFEGHPLNGVL